MQSRISTLYQVIDGAGKPRGTVATLEEAHGIAADLGLDEYAIWHKNDCIYAVGFYVDVNSVKGSQP